MDRRRRTRPVRSPARPYAPSFTEPLESRRLMSVSVAAVAADRFEPNDSYDAATNLGTLGDRTETGLSIHAPGNNDYYRFTAAASGMVSIAISFDQAQGDVDAILVNNERVIIANAATTNSTERLTAPVTAGQTYFLKVLGYNGATQPAYSLAVDGPNATTPTPTGDPDDQTSEARPFTLGATVSDSISTSTDVDLYKFTAAAGQRLAFDVDRASGSSLDSFIRVFNSAGSRITSNDNRAAPGETLGTDSYLEYTFTTAGTYYVGVSGSPNASYNANTGLKDVAGSMGAYSLRVAAPGTTPTPQPPPPPPPPPPTGDPDDQTSEARTLAIGGSISDSISTSKDVDLYKFTVRAGQRIGFDVDRASGSALNSFLRVFNSAGSRITSNDNRAAPGETLGTDSYLEYTFATGGTYYVGVSGSPNASYSAVTGEKDVAGSTGGYRLFLVNRSTTTAAAASAPQTLSMSLLPAASRDSDALLGTLGGRVV